MGVRILYDKEKELACLYCSTSGVAFGPIFNDDTPHKAVGFGADDSAELFLRWLEDDPRKLTDKEIMEKYSEYFKALEDLGSNPSDDFIVHVRTQRKREAS